MRKRTGYAHGSTVDRGTCDREVHPAPWVEKPVSLNELS